MRKFIENIFLTAVLLGLAVPAARAFTPGGTIGNGGDSWQTPTIGYGLPGDFLAPKNIGEEYRRVTPVMYYAADQTWIGFFGAVGLSNIDGAFALMNQATNVSRFYTNQFSDWPLQSQQLNYTAQTLGLTDLKSTTLGLLVEQMGLASPDRYVWTLHDRYLPPGGKCPADEEYLVVPRNFDVFNPLLYSSYINGTLYTFDLFENCTGPNPLAFTYNFSPDPFATINSAVASASGGLQTGGFYLSLTYDDAMGLYFLMNSNNVLYEATAPSGGVLLETNLQPPQVLNTVPISLLLAQSYTTNPPSALLAQYPGLSFLSVVTNLTTLITTNVSAYYTNLAGPYTNTVPFTNGASVYASNGIVPFTNWAPVQFTFNPQQLTTYPLGPFLNSLYYTDPVTLAGLYPGLQITSYTSNALQVQIITNVFPYYTNQTALPVYTNTAPGGLADVHPIYPLTTNVLYFTNQPGPTVINYNYSSGVYGNGNTEWVNISTLDLANFADAVSSNSPAQLLAAYPNLVIVHTNAYPGYQWVTNYVYYYTNGYGYPYPPPPRLVSTFTTNYVFTTNYSYTFANVFTNHYYTNRWVATQTVWVTNSYGFPYPSVLVTNTTTSVIKTANISGDFFIIPTNWCGFDLILSYPAIALNGVTNTLTASFTNTTSTNLTAYSATQNTFDIYTNYTYSVYPGICEPVLAYGDSYTTNIVNVYTYTFANVITNHYYTNTFVTTISSNLQFIPFGSPSYPTNLSVYNTNGYYTNLVSGDFYIVPTNWCGFEIISLIPQLTTTNSVVVATNPAVGGGAFYIATNTYYNTNYILSIRPGVCEPALYFATNYTTNVVTTYKYYFGNIITNSYYTNSPVVTLTTNVYLVTNALVGTLATNYVPTTTVYNGISGDFFIPSADWCSYSILSNQLQTPVYFTNTVTATNLPGVASLGQQYQQFTITDYTNSTLVVQPSLCGTATPPPALRQGIEGVTFVRANYDSLIGQFFQPLTNKYTMVMVTNGQQVVEYYQRVVTRPDFLLDAQDLASPNSPEIGVLFYTRNINFDNSQVLPGLAGPGTIIPTTTFTYNKSGPVYLNGSLASYGLATNSFLSQDSQSSASQLQWASFDGTTNPPVLYPDGTSLSNILNQLYIQVTPASVPNATNSVAYPPVTFSATGGTPPYTWAAPNIATLVPGMTFTDNHDNTATLSGTPPASTAGGVFTFTLQVTDAANRVVNLNYLITIQ